MVSLSLNSTGGGGGGAGELVAPGTPESVEIEETLSRAGGRSGGSEAFRWAYWVACSTTIGGGGGVAGMLDWGKRLASIAPMCETVRRPV